MRTPLIISLLLSLFTGYLCADMTIRYDLIGQHNKRPIHNIFIKQNLVRMNNLVSKKPDVMVNLTTGDIIQLHPESKSFYKINTQTINQYVSLYRQNKGFMQVLINQGIKHLDPQKRNKIQQMLNSYDQKSSASAFSFAKTSQTDRVLGVPCQIFSIIEQGQKKSDICLASYRQLELSQGDIKSLNMLKNLLSQFKQTAPEQQDIVTIMAKGLEKLDGLPMKIVHYSPSGKVKAIIRAGSISLRPVPQMAYKIPSHYEQKLMPFL